MPSKSPHNVGVAAATREHQRRPLAAELRHQPPLLRGREGSDAGEGEGLHVEVEAGLLQQELHHLHAVVGRGHGQSGPETVPRPRVDVDSELEAGQHLDHVIAAATLDEDDLNKQTQSK